MLYLLIGVALGVWDKALQNCATLDKAVIAATAFFFFVTIFQNGKFVFILHFLLCQTVKFRLKLVALGKSFFVFRVDTGECFFFIHCGVLLK